MPTPGTFAALWLDRVAGSPAQPFLLYEDADGRRTDWTYSEFAGLVNRARTVLARAGVGYGDAVHVALRNCPGFVALWIACALQGVLFVPVDPASSERELEIQLRRVGARLGVFGTARATPYLAAASRAGVASIGLAESHRDLAEHEPDGNPPAAVSPDDRLSVMFTSGTTSQPKGVVLTQANYRAVAETMARLTGQDERHRWYVTLPLFHANAQYYCFAPAIAAGASVALASRFSASGWVEGARRLDATHASLFAAPIRMILARTPADTTPLALEHVWFAQSLGREHFDRFAELAGVAPRQLYGMTETLAVVCADLDAVPRGDLIGRPVPGRRVRLVDLATGGVPAPGEPGMIQVAGVRGRSVFVEYLNDPVTTETTFETGADRTTWLRTGDLAVAEEGGALRFVGRADDVIKVAGENVSLTEVEAIVAQAPGVLEAAVVGQPDPVRDAVPVAYVVPVDPTAPPDPERLDQWARANLAPAAVPRLWHVIDALPRTSVGKVRRFMIGPDASLPDAHQMNPPRTEHE